MAPIRGLSPRIDARKDERPELPESETKLLSARNDEPPRHRLPNRMRMQVHASHNSAIRTYMPPTGPCVANGAVAWPRKSMGQHATGQAAHVTLARRAPILLRLRRPMLRGRLSLGPRREALVGVRARSEQRLRRSRLLRPRARIPAPVRRRVESTTEKWTRGRGHRMWRRRAP